MNDVTLSEFLKKSKPAVKELVDALRKDFDYVSILGTDVTGKTFDVRDKSTSVSDTNWVERGFVARVYTQGRYYEYAFNRIDSQDIGRLADTIRQSAMASFQIANECISYPLIAEEEIVKSFTGQAQILPEAMTSREKIERLRAIHAKAKASSDLIVNFIAICSNNHISKIFISDKKDLEQSYLVSEAYLISIVRRDEVTKSLFKSFSGMKGLDIMDEMEAVVEQVVKDACKLLDAKTIVPGEYDVICSPDAAGLIAHEAFGHGVEMDMFVKNRAKAVEYLNKPVASDIVVMRDGAASASHVSSYLFDDEGTLGGDTVIIKDGILKAGISDLLSALKLGTTPTGNGKRESFERKAYTRMTNTFFEPGKDRLEDMIASISQGYYIDRAGSGMEDPKDWGIQAMFTYAVEIVDGKLTDNIVAPVIMTGYVPDLLKSISMVSDDFELAGSGACGKGYKEFVKVSCGGPYIKAKARLG